MAKRVAHERLRKARLNHLITGTMQRMLTTVKDGVNSIRRQSIRKGNRSCYILTTLAEGGVRHPLHFNRSYYV